MTITEEKRPERMQAILNLVRGVPTQAQLRTMTDRELLEQINYDVADGRMHTVYSAEYDRRRAERNLGRHVEVLPRQRTRADGIREWAIAGAIFAACAAIAFAMRAYHHAG